MKLELVVKTDVSHVELLKNEKKVIGITIRNAKKTESGPAVKKIDYENPAGRSFAVSEGDIILSVNGQSTVRKKLKRIIQMVRNAGSCVHLQLQYEIQEIRMIHWGVYHKRRITTKLRKENGSFGFVLRKKDVTQHCYCAEYPVISNIKEGSRAFECRQLQAGDRLIDVDGVNISWKSLAEMASLLQVRDEAEFTFEYNVRVFNFAELEERLELDIDVPVSDLGLSPCLSSDATMYIASVRAGSIADRCGVFSEGDVILSINTINVKFLTISKVDSLLKNSQKIRKISFIKSKRAETEMSTSERNEVSSIYSAEIDRLSAETTSGIETGTDWKHVNTPASSNIAFEGQQNYYSRKFCHAEQAKAIGKFHDVISSMSSLKTDLSRLTLEAYQTKENEQNPNCCICENDVAEPSLPLCTSCLAGMNVKGAQSMESVRSIIAQFVNVSTRPINASPQNGIEERGVDEHQTVKISVGSVVSALTEALPSTFDYWPELREPFDNLAEKIRNADRSCSTCDFEIKSVMITVQKLLLLISLNDNSDNILDLIDLLITRLLESRFTCDEKSRHAYGVDERECNISVSENPSTLSKKEDRSLVSSIYRNPHNSENSKPNSARSSARSILNASQPNTYTNMDYLKIAHIEDTSESQDSECEPGLDVPEASRSSPVPESDAASNLPRVQERDDVDVCVSGDLNYSSEPVVSSLRKGKKLRKGLNKIWRSLDSLFGMKRSAKTQNVKSSEECLLTPKRCAVTQTNEDVDRAVPGPSSYDPGLSTDVCTETVALGGDSPSPRSRRAHKRHFFAPKRVRVDTVEVKLTNDGNGFGMGLDLRFTDDDDASVVPVIHFLKPNSPSHRKGTIAVGDRIIAINRREIAGMTAHDFVELKKIAFSARSVTLTIEFDVVDEKPKFGTFDVVVDNKFDPGMRFKGVTKGYPVIVAGVVKGSAAHRSGQIFPGDKILKMALNRSEQFNVLSCNYSREETIHVVIHRDPVESVRKETIDTSSCYINPCFSYEGFVPNNGSNFVVRNAAVRAVGTSAKILVLDQEVTLYRDRVLWDFGFLLGQNRETGRAYVSDLRPDGPAHQSGVIKKLDRIVKVNGECVDKRVENSALILLSGADHKVDLLIRRLYREDSEAKSNTHRKYS